MYKKKNKNFLDFEWFQTDFESAAFKSDSISSLDTASSSLFDTEEGSLITKKPSFREKKYGTPIKTEFIPFLDG